MKFSIYNTTNKPSEIEKNKIVNFLHKNLNKKDESKDDIYTCLSFALKERVSFGGFVIVAKEDEDIIGAVVINKTGMSGYLPENFLVYIATHNDYKIKKIEEKLIEKAIRLSNGDIALYITENNPSKKLYESLGFTTSQLVMRLKN